MQTCRNIILKFHPEWYINDDQRKESAEEAAAIGERLKKVYRDLGYSVREIDAADPSTWPEWARKKLERRVAAPKVERTKPGSELDFRVEYTNYKKWTDDRPGDGIDSDQKEYLEDIFSRGDVKRALKKLEKATEKYVKTGDKKPVEDAANAMRVDNGSEVTMDVLREVHKMEKAQLDKKQSAQQKKIVEALNVAKKKVRNASTEEMISRVARKIVADAGDVALHINVDEVFDWGGLSNWSGSIKDMQSVMEEMLADALLDSQDGIIKMVKAKIRRDRRLQSLQREGIELSR